MAWLPPISRRASGSPGEPYGVQASTAASATTAIEVTTDAVGIVADGPGSL